MNKFDNQSSGPPMGSFGSFNPQGGNKQKIYNFGGVGQLSSQQTAGGYSQMQQNQSQQPNGMYLDPNLLASGANFGGSQFNQQLGSRSQTNQGNLGTQMYKNQGSVVERSKSRGLSSRQGGAGQIGVRGQSQLTNNQGPPGSRYGNVNLGYDNTSLFDVVNGTSQSRAVQNAKSLRFTNQGRVSAAVHDNFLQDSPSRLNPNQVLKREREGAHDQNKEEAYRRENYMIFKKNLAEAFDEYNTSKDQYLDKQEFYNFMIHKAKASGQTYTDEIIEQIFIEMDIDQNGMIDVNEFIELQFKAFKNCEDNIEFLANDIKSFDEKIKEVEMKIQTIKERDSGYRIDGIPIMKGSTLTFNIIEGEFDDQFFDPKNFEPMIEILLNENEQSEHTAVIKAPKNMQPQWKEILTFDIFKPSDEIAIQIINQSQNQKEVLAEKRFQLSEIGQDENDPLHELKSQRRIEDILLISNQDGESIGQIVYQATWIYNKSIFLQELLQNMKKEREDLIREIQTQDKKLQLIAKPFGGYINILEIDDIHFEDALLPKNVKQYLQVTDLEQKTGQNFNIYASQMGLRDVRWGRATIIMFGIWSIATSFVCFQKPDFLNVSYILFYYLINSIQLTIALIGLLIFLDPQLIKMSYLRLLCATLLISEIYDLFWLIKKSEEFWNDTIEGGMQQVILVFIFMMFFYKIVIFIIMWRASLNFPKFVQQQRELVGYR